MIGRAIRKIRKDKGLTLDDVAGPCDVSAVTISRYERGERQPDKKMVRCIAGVLDTPVDQLFAVAAQFEPDEPVSTKESVSGYVASEGDRSAWRDAVYESDLSGETKLILTALALPQFINKSLWIVTTNVEEFLEVVKLDPELVRAHWDEAISSPFVERVGSVEWVLRLKFPE